MKATEPNAPKSIRRCDAFFSLVLAYLVLPNLIFLLTWVRPWIGVPAAIAVMGCSIFMIWRSGGWEPRQGLDRRNLIFILAVAFFWTLMAGAGGFVPQSFDYMAHNLRFHDLIHRDWPVKYSLPDGGQRYLCYGVGYYLAPALGGRLLGEAAMPGLTFLWTFCGTALCFYWVASRTGKPKTTLLIFLLFAATNGALYLLKQAGLPGFMPAALVREKLDQLGLYHSYYDMFTKLHYQPQHAMPAWLGTALLYELLWVKRNPAGAFFVWCACLLWSPLTSIGLLVVPLAAVRHISWRAWFTGVNLAGGGVLMLIMGVYFQGHVQLAENGPIWKSASGPEWLPFFLIFDALELTPVLFILLLDRKYRVLGDLRPLFLVAAAWLTLVPLYKIGHCADLRMEGGTPGLVIAALGAACCLQSKVFSLKRPLFILLAGSLLIGAVYPLIRPWQNLLCNRKDYSYAASANLRGFHNLSEYREPGFDAAAQYLGRNDSLAVRWLLR